jgi:NAD(P)-dependent dehydrogenase (short-subunit alcohol dehydrogenase family)
MTVLRFDGEVAIVTGAASGLGLAYATSLASRGASVVVNDVATAAADEVVEEFRGRGWSAVASHASVSETAEAETIVATAIEAFGRIDVVINNAGIARPRGISRLTDDELDHVLKVHLYGTFNVIRPAWPHLCERKGRVLNTTSSVGLFGAAMQANYAAAKAGVIGLTKTLAQEGAPKGVRVNAIAPVARTPMTEGAIATAGVAAARSGSLGELLASLTDMLPALDPSLVASAVTWLVHSSCTANGEVFGAGGGRMNRFVVGMTPGYYSPDLSPELARDHFAEVCATDSMTFLTSTGEDMEQLRDLLVRP